MAYFNPSAKCLVLCLLIGFLLIFMLSLLDSEDSEVREYEKLLKQSELTRQRRELEKLQQKRRDKNAVVDTVNDKPVDWGVQFISGKEMVKVVDGEHKSIQMHTVTIENLGEIDALVQCRDSFSKFSHIIPPGLDYNFSVTDIFHKRHYWCTAHYGKHIFDFVAYGEGAPRDNNHIVLKKEGAFINGKDMTKRKKSKGDDVV